ncbi:hypothetical protein LCGC14_2165820 [marine sediment metagenome]|uniref:Uncharacterized protein n=1 Tax=marine sediment metagenome TaxID=412755 RepID=A0A0F9GML8_9ZZZZ
MTPKEMAERCAKCSSENVICLYGAARLISNAQAEQRRKLVHPEFHRWCVRVSGPGLDWTEIGSLVKTYLEDDAIEQEDE